MMMVSIQIRDINTWRPIHKMEYKNLTVKRSVTGGWLLRIKSLELVLLESDKIVDAFLLIFF